MAALHATDCNNDFNGKCDCYLSRMEKLEQQLAAAQERIKAIDQALNVAGAPEPARIATDYNCALHVIPKGEHGNE
jgi:hypothetical protein